MMPLLVASLIGVLFFVKITILNHFKLKYFKSDVWLSVHCNSMCIRNQLDVTFVLFLCKREIKDNTKVTSSWFLIHTHQIF